MGELAGGNPALQLLGAGTEGEHGVPAGVAVLAVHREREPADQERWRAKVEALAAWAVGPYREAFGAETLTIATVTRSEGRE